MWIWRAIALPSHLRVLSHISHERSADAACAFLAKFKARTDGHPPFFTSDKLPAYVAALVANYSTPEPTKRGPGRPRKTPRRILDKDLLYAQVDKRRENGHGVEVSRRIIFGSEGEIAAVIEADGCGTQINTSYVERDNLTARQSNGRLVRKTLSHSKKVLFLQRHSDLDDAMFNFTRPHRGCQLPSRSTARCGRKPDCTPAMAAGLTDHVWSLDELLAYRIPPSAS